MTSNLLGESNRFGADESDREHTTILVTGLASNTEVARLESYFADVSERCDIAESVRPHKRDYHAT